MKKTSKILSLFLIALFLITIVSSLALAANTSGYTDLYAQGNEPVGDRMMGDAGGAVASTASSLLETLNSWKIKLGVPPYHQVTFLSLLLCFIIILSVLFPVSGKLPFFKDADAARSRTAFTVAASLLVTYFSPVAFYVYNFLVYYVSSLMSIGMLALFIVMLVLIWRHSSHAVKDSGDMMRQQYINHAPNKSQERQIKKSTWKEKRDGWRENNIARKARSTMRDIGNFADNLLKNLNSLKDALSKSLEKLGEIREQISKGTSGSDSEVKHAVNGIINILRNARTKFAQEASITDKIAHLNAKLNSLITKEEGYLKNSELLEAKLKGKLRGDEVISIEKQMAQYTQQADYINREIHRIESELNQITNNGKEFISIVEANLGKAIEHLQNQVPEIDLAMNYLDHCLRELPKEQNVAITIEKLVEALEKLENNEIAILRRVIKTANMMEVQENHDSENVDATTKKRAAVVKKETGSKPKWDPEHPYK